MREKKDINIEIGGNIQVAREQAGYTQDTLSEMLGMTPNHLSAIERGASGISLEALQRLCRLLGVSADRIIFGTDEPETEALALARRISDIKPEYRQQVQELLSAILNMILSILVYTFFSRMFDLMLPPVAKHSIVVA